mmetsp:Transcript_38682/g.80348  ORF Transcript_38682/g.80348 Transcript_38682/m.80348 type:complete len:613 (-) Transcript_38682:245-2083(-)|eukprot:CAMPEP_0172452468 /NCGR_PEP_ID=MMETSP1065-20121228/10115_1 /TAXON_ID=265537 /ORGANISM="Amphiprora paludosa, Strain CCMP125" /LENGTH=612 /DNA_ID=CAMNT_0013204525 /DNA_START=79 /DNA_END=1917 /DNA_ORIENTATION=+
MSEGDTNSNNGSSANLSDSEFEDEANIFGDKEKDDSEEPDDENEDAEKDKKKSKKSKKKKTKKSSTKRSSSKKPSKMKKKKSKRNLEDGEEGEKKSSPPKRATPRMDSGISSMGDSMDSDSDDEDRKQSRDRDRPSRSASQKSVESYESYDGVPDELPDMSSRKPPRSQSGPLEQMAMAEAIAMGLDPSMPGVLKPPPRATSGPLDSMSQSMADDDDKDREAPARSTSMPLRDAAQAVANDNEMEQAPSRRSMFSRGGSSRSVGSQGSNKSGKSRFSRMGTSFRLGRGFSTRSVDTTDTSDMSVARSQREHEKKMSAVERREKRLMKRELKNLKNYRKRLLEKKIKEEGGPRWNFLLAVVTVVTAAELGLDMGTTILSLVSIMSSFECCGEEIGVSPWLLGTTIPYFVLVMVEFILLGFSIKQARANTAKDKLRFKKIDELDEDQEWFSDEEDNDNIDEVTGCQKDLGHVIHWVILLNPFLGCLIAWFLLYEVASKTEAFIILGLEGGAVFLMFVGCYLKRDKFTFNSLLLHGLPLIPLGALCFMIWYYLREGGVCFKNGTFTFDGCELCSERDPTPAVGGICWNGANPYQGTFCGDTPETRFCYFSYERDS